MDPRRAETLEALSAYLQHQRALLARTHADIERLKELKAEALASPEQRVNRSSLQENDPRLLNIKEKISELQDYHPAQSFPNNIDWEAFSSTDPTPLRTLAIRTRIDYTQQTVPSSTQRSPLSLLQKFVKDARKVILDPVFANLSATDDMDAFSNPTATSNSHLNSPSSHEPNRIPTLTLPPAIPEIENEEDGQEPVVQESNIAHSRHDQACAKVRGLKKRKFKTHLESGCKLGEEGSNRILVPKSPQDKTPNGITSMQSCITMPPGDTVSMDVDDADAVAFKDANAEFPNPSQTHHLIVPQRDNASRSSRSRKPSLKLQFQSLTALTGSENKPTPTSTSSQSLGKRSRDIAEINDTVCKLKSEPLSVSDVCMEPEKNRSETYKQAWSISEQHLLERLLEEIPDGERNRWAKISQAMEGRRTPRQVASRVQKYFEKLKRFGVGVDNTGKAK